MENSKHAQKQKSSAMAPRAAGLQSRHLWATLLSACVPTAPPLCLAWVNLKQILDILSFHP